MGPIRRNSFLPVVLLFALLFSLLSPVVPARSAADRHLVNASELHNEIEVARGAETAVKDYLPSFLEYQDLVLFHPKFGYYSSGRVNFWGDYQTFPGVLAPYFGHMITEQIFRMWQGMRRAGTLGPKDVFTIAEFGAGDGALAESIMDYLDQQAKESPDQRWREFMAQVRYVCYDRSPALSKTQSERNARFGKRFEAREADATNPTATIPPGSLKGVVLSNELPDAFSVHKVALSTDGSAEVAFVAPSLPRSTWDKIKKDVPAPVVEAVTSGDRTVRDRFFAGKEGRIYFTRAAFVALLDALSSSDDYASTMESFQFNEAYVPARLVPELSEHFRRYARLYATELAKHDEGVVTYINLGVEKFIQGAGHVLSAGYVITLDYGTNWDGIMEQKTYPHLRTYGPAHQEENWHADTDAADSQPAGGFETSDPYRGPTLNDITTDVNFSLMAAEGRLAGLTTAYFGPQSAIQTGTPISLSVPPPRRQGNGELIDEFNTWAESFQTNTNYKLMVQQKDKTDASYSYPDKDPERLASDQNALSGPQQQKAAQIEKRLSGAPEAGAPAKVGATTGAGQGIAVR
jgi:SAM-dependent MidA family methyltransferase